MIGYFCSLLLFFPLFLVAIEPFFVTFNPPKGWVIADPTYHSEEVKIGFIGSKKKAFSPSITLHIEKIGQVSREVYIKAVKRNFELDPLNRCNELGKLTTKSGTATLIQVDMDKPFGKISILQAITLFEGYVIIHSVAFPTHLFLSLQETFFDAFSSLTIYPTVFSSCDHPNWRQKIDEVTDAWQKHCLISKKKDGDVFQSLSFQDNVWKPFVNYIENELKFKGSCWQILAIKSIKKTLLKEKDP